MTAVLFFGCGVKQEDTIYATKGSVSQLFPGYKIIEHIGPPLDFLSEGAAVEAYDVQAAAALESRLAGFWYPLTLETVVIAVDRDKTDMAFATWSDLQNSTVSISLPNANPMGRLAAAALCYGLEGENFTLATAVRLLEPIAKNSRLKLDDTSAPIQICFDSYAAARIRNG